MPHEISPGTMTGADQLAEADTESSALRDYFAATLGTTEGWLAAAFGYGGHFDANGKYTFAEWRPRFYQWPADIERAVAEFTQESHLADVYLSPYVMISAVRRKGDSVSRPIRSADVDGELDFAKAVALGAGVFVIDSGRGTHVYVALSESVPLQWHRVLEEGLRDYLGGDDKISDNDLLRPPGTLNRKCDEPVSVSWLIRPTGQRSDVHALAAVLGVTLEDEDIAALSATACEVVPVDVDLDAYPAVRAAVEQRKHPPDRSKEQFRIVGACVDAGLDDLAKILGIIYRYRSDDLGKRLAERGGADDVVACLEKVRASRWWTKRQAATGDDVADVITSPARYFDRAGLRARTLLDDCERLGPLASGIDGKVWCTSMACGCTATGSYEAVSWTYLGSGTGALTPTRWSRWCRPANPSSPTHR